MCSLDWFMTAAHFFVKRSFDNMQYGAVPGARLGAPIGPKPKSLGPETRKSPIPAVNALWNPERAWLDDSFLMLCPTHRTSARAGSRTTGLTSHNPCEPRPSDPGFKLSLMTAQHEEHLRLADQDSQGRPGNDDDDLILLERRP